MADFSDMIEVILDTYGIKESELASRLDIKQPTVNRLRRGKIKNPNFDLGTRILDLYEKRPQTDAA